MRPLIVLTNDDGIHSPGLRAAVCAVADLGEILVVAPREQESSASRAFFGRGRTRAVRYLVEGKPVRAFSAPCSPAVAVRHALLLIAERKPALLISGINYGENMGSGVTISGTVGAALEAAGLDVPSMAASLATPKKYHRSQSSVIDFSAAAHYTRELAWRILKHGMPPGADILNLNVPQGVAASTAWRWTRLSRQSYFRSTIEETRGARRFSGYELHVDPTDLEPDSDIHAVHVDHVVSVSPLTLDLTARVSGADLQHWKGRRLANA